MGYVDLGRTDSLRAASLARAAHAEPDGLLIEHILECEEESRSQHTLRNLGPNTYGRVSLVDMSEES